MPHAVRNPRKPLVNLPENQNEIKLVSAPNAISTSAQFNIGRLARCELSLLLPANLEPIRKGVWPFGGESISLGYGPCRRGSDPFSDRLFIESTINFNELLTWLKAITP